jgi:hypothetical protein
VSPSTTFTTSPSLDPALPPLPPPPASKRPEEPAPAPAASTSSNAMTIRRGIVRDATAAPGVMNAALQFRHEARAVSVQTTAAPGPARATYASVTSGER